jgi:enoyl-CoA hydratase/carnithine racemase
MPSTTQPGTGKTMTAHQTDTIQFTPAVRLRRDGQVAIVELSRPDRHNAVTDQTLYGVEKAQRYIARDRTIRAVVITGEGASFCSGLDMPAMLKKPLTAVRLYLQLYLPWANLFQRWSMGWRNLDVPVIAAIHGHCYGAGIQLALGADIRIAHPQAQLSVMEIRWGLIPDMGGAALLRELVRIDVAKQLMMSGDVLPAEEALQVGLITRIEADPLVAALATAHAWARQPRKALAQAKRLSHAAYNDGEYGVLRQERLSQRALLGRAEQRSVVQSRMKGKKKPAGEKSADTKDNAGTAQPSNQQQPA